MTLRVRLAALLGLLLPLPMMALMSVALYGHGWGQNTDPSRPHTMGLVPMLTSGERQSLHSYKQECETDTDCEPPLRCFYNMLAQSRLCTDSACLTDHDCPEGFACQTEVTKSGKELLHVCSVVGVRKEGEGCLMLPREREDGCKQGLLCRGYCGRPCRLDDASTCPGGYFCKDDPAGPSCQPTCEGRSCPEGQRCVSRGSHVSVCATVHGRDCQMDACPQEQVCSIYDYPDHPRELWMDCLSSCGTPGDGVCPEGTVCYLYRCRQSCTPEDSSACGTGFSCGHRAGEPWTCVPDVGETSTR